MQYYHTICSLFSYAFLFSDCNSKLNVPKTIYTAKIVDTYRGIFLFDAVALKVTQNGRKMHYFQNSNLTVLTTLKIY